MRIALSCLAVFLCLGALAPRTATAFTFGGEVFGAYNTYSMEDVNDEIDAANDLGADFDELSGGLGGGLGLRMWPSSSFMVSAVWEPLFLETDDEATDATLNLDANSFQATGGFFFPSTSNQRYGIGAGVGYYTIAGESEAGGTAVAVEGSGIGYHVLGMAEWTVSPGFAITGGAGYRFADIEIDDAPDDFTADYTGFMGRLGLAFYFPSSTP